MRYILVYWILRWMRYWYLNIAVVIILQLAVIKGAVLSVQVIYPEDGEIYLGASLTLQCRHNVSSLDHNSTKLQNCNLNWTLTNCEQIPCVLPNDTTVITMQGGDIEDRDEISHLYIESLQQRHTGVYSCNLFCTTETISSSLSIIPQNWIQTTNDATEDISTEGPNDNSTHQQAIKSYTEEIDTTTVVNNKRDSVPNTWIEEEVNSVANGEWRVGIGAAVVIVIALLAAYTVWVKSRSRARPVQTQCDHPDPKLPTYDEVMNNPDKYPTSNPTTHGEDVSQQEQGGCSNLAFDVHTVEISSHI